LESSEHDVPYGGRVRLFPLPNLVMFPHVMQPLHIFEPRYCALLEDALADDRRIAMALLCPGWEGEYDGRPAIEPVACLGRIATCQPQPEGRYNLLLVGVSRVVVTRELPPEKTFREALVEELRDVYPSENTAGRPALYAALLQAFKKVVPKLASSSGELEQLFSGAAGLGTLTDLVGYALDLPLPVKMALLKECDVDRRAEILIEQLSQPQPEKPDGFPPSFSAN